MSTQRVALWDNARFGAIALMVAGHALTKMVGENDAAFTLYVFIYAFHVPVFVAVSGYFTKGTAPDDRRIRSVFTDILVPYVIFELIWSVVYFLYNGNYRLDLTRASWTLWFLLALAVWRILLPYLVALKYPLLISIVISIEAGYFPIDQTFSAARVLGFLPFFVFGWQLREWNLGERWMALCSQSVLRWRILAVGFMAVVAVFIALNVPLLRELQIRSFITYDSGFATFGYDQWWAGLGRLAAMMVAAAMIMAFLILIPREKTWFTQFGQATMYVYLLHTFVLFPLREYGVLDGERPLWYILLVLVGAVGLTVLLSTPLIVRIFKPLVQPSMSWLFVTPRDSHR
ncbi:fucose 4-O-acetylase-like acetyltransferase [Aurantimicrobium minutum]|uniref:acyltransferase family protein n=1 Tax=Aurantimicrobium minutum TaxID=708131 RepID=UPI002475B6EA|nr:acyltransferase family protein [Aurantimicrobium minutum]MDH6531793.1 fucose 4-O-acetylase-like acetyltransferase [Aurantimicrobium minutum]